MPVDRRDAGRCAVAGVAAALLLAGCTPAAESPPREAVPTARQRGVVTRLAGTWQWQSCDALDAAPRAIETSMALDSAQAALGEVTTPTFADVEATTTASGPLSIVVVHRLGPAGDAVVACRTPAVEADAAGHAPAWRAWFTRDSLFVIGAPGQAGDTLAAPATRAPAIDGTVLYRTRAAAGRGAIVLSVSPMVERRGIREGTAQVARRAEGCHDTASAQWSNATATLMLDSARYRGCAAYAEPVRDPAKRRRRA